MRDIMMVMGLLALMGSACAERILTIDFDVYMNDSVVVHSLRMEDGNPTKYVRPGDYEIKLLDGAGNSLYNTSVKLDYILYSDPPRDMNPAPLGMRIGYDSGMKRVELYNRGRLIFAKELDLCNRDGTCDSAYESYLSCPSDCRLDKIDGMCIKSGDGTCDPDCVSGADPDCGNRLPAVSGFLPYVLAAVASLCALVYVVNRKKEKK